MSQHKLACEAVLWKHGYSFSTADDEIIPGSWNGPELSQVAIDAAVSEYVAHLDAVAYREDRRDAYADIGDQLDMQYHDLLDDTTTWRDHVATVKAAHPKP